MKIGSLFAGIGGGDLAVEHVLGGTVAWQLDLVGAAVRRRHWPAALQIEADVRTVDPATLPVIDVLVAGFPCQDLSQAGTGGGLDGARSGLYREVVRFVAVLQPRYLVLENVPGLLRYMPRLQSEFGALGYGLTWTTVRAVDAGHPHLRKRVFVLGERAATGSGFVGPTPPGRAVVRPWATVTASNPNEGEDPASWQARRVRTTASSRPISEPLAQQVLPWATVKAADARSPGAGTGTGAREGSDGLAVQARPWPTVVGSDAASSGSRSKPGSRAHAGTSLTDAVRADRATADDARPWPTVATRDYRVGSGLDRVGTPPLSDAAAPTGGRGRRLNPDWIEQLMGYPVGWTLPTGPALDYDPDAPGVRGRYPADWDRTQVWPGYAWEAPRTLPDGPPIKGRADRIRALGNAWCPQQGALALCHLMEKAR